MIYASRRSQLVPIIFPLNQKRGRSVFFKGIFSDEVAKKTSLKNVSRNVETRRFWFIFIIGNSWLFRRDYKYKIRCLMVEKFEIDRIKYSHVVGYFVILL